MIRTSRLILRDFTPADLDAFAAVLGDAQAMRFWDGPYTRAQAQAELRHYLDHRRRHGYAPFAVWLDGQLIGDIGLQRLEDGPEIELLYRLLPSAWGRGLTSEACEACLDYAFSALGAPQVVAVIPEANAASRRLAARLGFTEGELGTYYGKRMIRYFKNPS